MSRTIRRKNYEDTQGGSWARNGRKTAGYYTQKDLTRHWMDGGDYYYWVFDHDFRVPTDREYGEDYWKLHGDTNSHWAYDNPGAWWRRDLQKSQRQKGRQEIHKFMRNEEYEPIIESRRDKSWWYWL